MKLSLAAKKMIMLIAVSSALVIAVGVALCFALESLTTSDILPVTLGVLLMFIINVARVFLLEHQVNKLSSMEDPNKARLFATGHGFLRFALLGGGLVAAHFIPFTNLIAAIAGAFTFNIAAYGLKFVKLDDADPAPYAVTRSDIDNPDVDADSDGAADRSSDSE